MKKWDSYLKDAFCLLQEDQSFLVVLSLDEIKSGIRQLSEDDWYFVLVNFDFFVIHLVERVALLRGSLVSAFRLRILANAVFI